MHFWDEDTYIMQPKTGWEIKFIKQFGTVRIWWNKLWAALKSQEHRTYTKAHCPCLWSTRLCSSPILTSGKDLEFLTIKEGVGFD